MTTLEKLRAMRGRLAAGWLQGCYAVDEKGSRVGPCWPEAARWCLIGAMHFPVGGPCDYLPIRGEVDEALRCLILDALPAPTGIASWNDAAGRTQEEVLALVDRVIAEQEARA